MNRTRLWQLLYNNIWDTLVVLISSYLVVRYTVDPNLGAKDLLAGVCFALGLMAINGVIERLIRFERLWETITAISSSIAVLAEKANPVGAKLSEAPLNKEQFVLQMSEIRIAGITLSSTLPNLRMNLIDRLRAGATIRVIILNHRVKPALEQLCIRSWEQVNSSHYQEALRHTESELRIIGTSASPGKLQVGLLPYVPPFGILAGSTGDAPDAGTLAVELYHVHTLAANPSFLLSSAKDQHWYKFFAQQFEEMWNKCTEYQNYPDESVQGPPTSESQQAGNRRSP